VFAVQQRVKKGALPNVPLAELRPVPPERQRVPPGQRAEQRAATERDEQLASMLESIHDLELEGKLSAGTRDVVKRALEAAAEERDKHERTKERLSRKSGDETTKTFGILRRDVPRICAF
jgi:hypothetical protein